MKYLLFFCLLFTLLYSQEKNSPYKQLAASPEDFSTGNLSLPKPSFTGTHSHCAMIPVQFSLTPENTYLWTETLYVDGSQNFGILVLSPSSSWNIQIQPDGESSFSLNTPSSLFETEETSVQFGQNDYPATLYSFRNIQPKNWQITIKSESSSSRYGIDGYIVYTSKNPYRLYTHLNTHQLTSTQSVVFHTYIYDLHNAYSEKEPSPPIALNSIITQAELHLYKPNGSLQIYPLQDAGNAGDTKASDGVFSLQFLSLEPGDYLAHLFVYGVTPEGQNILRTCQYTFPIVSSPFTLSSRDPFIVPQEENRVSLHIPLQTADFAPVKAFTEVWGTDESSGQMVFISWIGGITQALQSRNGAILPLSLDTRWIARSGAKAPFFLKNFRIHHLDKEVLLLHKKQASLESSKLPLISYNPNLKITSEMLMGKKPETKDSKPSQKPEDSHSSSSASNTSNSNNGLLYSPMSSTSGKLLLIHGYCSSDVWSSQNFTNRTVFLDLGKNRSHNEFAQLIRTFSTPYPSFGAVAHSQGGCASLHLYTYYWSGFDNASAGRLIQSVGTPYQGTALAGNLAALGNVFGAGCGTNTNLTYDGASLWLSGIPSWARSKVYYYTTQVTDDGKWWTWDRCHAGTDFFLDDPEDGTTEKDYGQLSGANNMGHKQGWCHTSGMNNPAQTTDSSRNSTMNSSASR